MRNAILVSILTVVLVVSAAAVWAGPPLSGTWKTTDGDFDEGTATSKWAAPGYLGVGAVIYGRSYNGGFTNDWTINCPMVASVLLISGTGGGTGNSTYMITYTGGYETLGGPGNPWDGGDAVYTGTITSYYEFRTVQYVSGKIVGAVSDHDVSAHIQGYNDSCAAWAIGNGVLIGTTPHASFVSPIKTVKDPNYPDFPAPGTCLLSPNGPGHWDDIRDLTLSITGCTVATQPTTWGGVKSMYRN